MGGVAEINNQKDQHYMTYIFLGEEGSRKESGIQATEINRIHHYIAEWTRKSHLSIRDLRFTCHGCFKSWTRGWDSLSIPQCGH